jgi:hypothetical protein
VDAVGRIAIQRRQQRPTRFVRLEVVARAPAMLYPNDRSRPTAQHRRQPIDAVEDSRQRMLRRSLEQPDLHVDDKHSIHRGAPFWRSLAF